VTSERAPSVDQSFETYADIYKRERDAALARIDTIEFELKKINGDYGELLYTSTKTQADRIAQLEAELAEAQTLRVRELEAALRGLYNDQADYLTINKLGGMDNHWMKAARAALAQGVKL
jgi:hypothetical protein